jgi:hypothetical protein
MLYLDNHLITLNSSDAIQLNSTYLSNVVFPFRGLLKDDVNIIRSYITLINAQIPVSFYVIDLTNNVIKASFGGSFVNYYIPTGNYNATTLTAALVLLLQHNLAITFNTADGTITFKSTVYMIFSLNFNSPNGSGALLGFGNTSSYSTAVGVITSPYPINLLGKNKLFINSSNLNNVAYTSHNTGFSTCICTIPINVPPYGLIQYSSLTDQNKNILVNRVLDTIDIQVLDLNNNFINFNNVNWSITLCLSIEKMDANKFHIQSFNNYLGNQPIQPKEIELNPPEKDKELEFLMGGT